MSEDTATTEAARKVGTKYIDITVVETMVVVVGGEEEEEEEESVERVVGRRELVLEGVVVSD